MQSLNALGHVAGSDFFRELAHAISLVGGDVAAQNINELMAPWTRFDRQGQRKNLVPKSLFQLSEYLVEINMFPIGSVHHKKLWNAELCGVIPDRPGADPQAVRSVGDDDRHVAHTERAECFADEVLVTRRVDKVKFLVLPFEVEKRGADGDLPFVFGFAVIGNGRTGLDAAEAVDHAAASEQAFREHGFATRSVAHNGEVPYVTRLICIHSKTVLRLTLIVVGLVYAGKVAFDQHFFVERSRRKVVNSNS